MLWPWPISTNLFGNSAAVTPFVWARGQHLIWEKPKKFPLCPVSLVAHCFCPGWRHLPTDKRVWAGCLLPWSLLLSRFCLSLTSDSAPRAFRFSEDHLTHWIHNRLTEDISCTYDPVSICLSIKDPIFVHNASIRCTVLWIQTLTSLGTI